MVTYQHFQLFFGKPANIADSSDCNEVIRLLGFRGSSYVIRIESPKRRIISIGALNRDPNILTWKLGLVTHFVPHPNGQSHKRKCEIVEQMPALTNHFLTKIWVRCNFRWLMDNYISPDLLRYIGIEI